MQLPSVHSAVRTIIQGQLIATGTLVLLSAVPILATCALLPLPLVSSLPFGTSTMPSSWTIMSAKMAGGDGYAAFSDACHSLQGASKFENDLQAQNQNSKLIAGCALDPAFGAANEVGLLADYGYDTARDAVRFATYAVLIGGVTLAIWRIGRLNKLHELTASRFGKYAGLVGLVATLVNLIGNFVLNNCGEIGVPF